MMRPLICLGRGVEGAGCTAIAIQLYKYLNSRGNEPLLMAGSDKKWGRENAHKCEVTKLSFAEQLDDICKLADDYTHILLASVPAKNFDRRCQDNFMSFLKHAHDAGKKVIYFQFDHKIHSIIRNMYAIPDFFGMFKYVDMTLTHSTDGDFVKFCQKHDIMLNNLVTAHTHGIDSLNGMDFEVMKKYWKPFEQKEYRTVKYIGRSAAWKGPYLFREIHEKYLKDAGYISTCEGIELSIGSLQFLFKELHPRQVRDDTTIVLHKKNIDAFRNGTYNIERHHSIYMLPPYDHDEAMERLSKCQFGLELLILVDSMAKNVMEVAMFEMVATGCIPVFRKRWCEMFMIDGKSIYDYGFEQNGTVMLDEEHPEESIELMNKLSDDKEMYDKYRNIAFDFYSKHFNAKTVYDKIFNVIESMFNEEE